MATVTRSASNSPLISLTSPLDPSLFPLKSINDVVNFFKRSLELYHTQNVEPDLTLLSIVAGYIELSLTTGDAAQAAAASAAEHASASSSSSAVTPSSLVGIVGSGLSAAAHNDIITGNSVPFPEVTYELVSGLYKKFQSILSIVEKPKVSSTCNSRQATREVIKKVSDVIWHSLIRSSYKDRAHLQNLYSYLSGNKLDCFGVALAVVAGCQLLGYRDVRLAISEDHAWVVFGNKRLETIEITWHGKGSEDKRGQDITSGIESGSWLYLGGLAVVCDKPMEVAAIASAINISLSANSDCVEVQELQQRLLWLLYDMGHLRKYPMALGTLGELEEINPTSKRVTCDQLYREAIESAKAHYKNHHVYPYTYQGNYFNRLNKYREAFAAWANAADVIRLYTYQCRDDEEIYKELLDIANEMIPYVMKTESSGHSARSILRDSEVFANLLRFYDGICQWEEDSLTPILHIGWAKPLVNNICKFDYDVRSQVVIKVPEDEPQAVRGSNVQTTAEQQQQHRDHDETTNEAKAQKANAGDMSSSQHIEGNNNLVKKEEKCNDGKKCEMPTTLADLTAACGEKILNPDFLLQGGGQPFAEQQKLNNQHDETTNGTDKKAKTPKNEATTSSLNDTTTKSNTLTDCNMSNTRSEQSSSSSSALIPTLTTAPSPTPVIDEEDPLHYMFKRPVITLYSQKMKGLKDLLLAEKLNTHAISLQVTAQSVASKKIRGVDKLGNHTTNSTYSTVNLSSTTDSSTAGDSIAVSRPKRTRRE
ncbi:menin isoform X1 [Lucilia sericata]|uniref:menin isoform X1 n=1 Tax=Lucilia sericata TaxID=13632 RepID=UPI0018A84FB7|nr:menin isoform X1 [Lucilia sericata]XP_037823196.1 menin isoform X1 [Lucilia sericata]